MEEYELEPYVYAQNILGDEHAQFGVALVARVVLQGGRCHVRVADRLPRGGDRLFRGRVDRLAGLDVARALEPGDRLGDIRYAARADRHGDQRRAAL